MKVLVTGATGFVGKHLIQFLLGQKGLEVYGLGRSQGKNNFYECDITDLNRVREVISQVKPDRIFHLAAQSSVPVSWNLPVETMKTNVMGQIHLLEAVRETAIRPLILIACSSEEYGAVSTKDIPVKETQALQPLSPYGVSKVAQDLLAEQYFQTFGLPIVRTRAFSHTGPGQREEYAASNFAKQIACIEAGEKEPVLKVGNLDVTRDFTDVRDVVRAYWLALEKGKPGEVYNVCSGIGCRIQQMVDILVGLSRVKIEVRKETDRVRPVDVPAMVGDAAKFRNQTGWTPTIGIQTTMADLLNDWRARIDSRKIQSKN